MNKNRFFVAGRAAVTLSFVVVFLICSGKAEAQTASDFTYGLWNDDKEIWIREYIGMKGGNIVIPAKIEGYPVTQIAKRAFRELTDGELAFLSWAGHSNPAGTNTGRKERITSVEIPDTVWVIGDDAFNGCQDLKQVKLPKLPNSSKKHLIIYPYAFAKTGLTSVAIPDNTYSIDSGAFKGCPDLTSVTIGKRVSETHVGIGEEAFADCLNLTTVKFSGSVGYVNADGKAMKPDNDAFRNCPRLSLAQKKAIQDSGYEGRFDDWY
jgi:hypothetical protein